MINVTVARREIDRLTQRTRARSRHVKRARAHEWKEPVAAWSASLGIEYRHSHTKHNKANLSLWLTTAAVEPFPRQ